MSRPKDFLCLTDWSPDDIRRLIARAAELKLARQRRESVRPLEGSSVLLYFAKASLRTFVTFEIGIAELGGFPVYLPPGQVKIGDREPVEDVSRNLERWVHMIVARVYEHDLIERMARYARVPVVNALSDYAHPCQAVADALTMHEHGGLERRLVYVGDGNNVAHSLIFLATKLGMRLRVCTPESYRPAPQVVAAGERFAAESGAELEICHDPVAAMKDAGFVYTDVWASMGQEDEADDRAPVFAPYQINAGLLSHAPADVTILHCLPAHRGEEITAEVFESPASKVFDQAENRLHAQKAIMEALVSG